MKTLVLPLLLLIPAITHAQVRVEQRVIETVRHQFQFGLMAAGPGDIFINALSVHPDGQIAIAGLFDSNTLDLFDRWNARTQQRSVPDKKSGYLASFDKDGNVAWSVMFDGPATVNATAVGYCQDLTVVVGGWFFGNEFNITDAHSRTTLVTAKFGSHGIVRDYQAAWYAKFDASGGLIWAKEWSGTTDALVNFMICDSKNRIVMSGQFPPTSSDYLPPSNTANAVAGGQLLPLTWMTGGVREVVGSAFFECTITFPPPGNTYPVWSSGQNTNIQLIQVDSNLLRWYNHRPVLGWLSMVTFPINSPEPLLANTTGRLAWSYEFLDWTRMIIRASWNERVFLESSVFAVDPFLNAGTGSGGYLRRPDAGTVFPNAGAQGQLKFWRGMRTFMTVNADGNILWTKTLNITATTGIVTGANGLLTIAGLVPGTANIGMFRFLDTGMQLWSVSLNGLTRLNRTDVVLTAIGMDREGNVAVVGRFDTWPLAFMNMDGSQAATVDPQGSNSGFVVYYDTFGMYQWHATLSSLANYQMNTVAIDRLGNVAIGGVLTSATTVYNSTGGPVASFSNAATLGGYVLRFSSTGQYLDLMALRGMGSVIVKELAYNSVGELFASGDFLSPTISVLSQGVTSSDVLSNPGNQAGFLIKFNYTASLTTTTVRYTSTLGPTPTTTLSQGSSNDFFKDLFDRVLALGQVTLIVILVLAILFCCFGCFALRMFWRYTKMKAVGKNNNDAYFVIDQLPTKSVQLPKISGAFPHHLEMRNNYDFKQGERLPTGPDTFLFMCTLRGAANNPTLGRGQNKNDEMVIKVFAKSEALLKEEQKFKFNMEITALWKLKQHKSIMKMAGFCREPVGLIMKRYQCGSISNWIHAGSQAPVELTYSLKNLTKMMVDIARAVQFVHQNKLIHGDLNSSNILLDKTLDGFIPVLTDFSSARPIDSPDTSRVIKSESIPYTAPEVLFSFSSESESGKVKPQIVKAGDVYALGVIMVEMIHRRLWSSPDNKTQIANPAFSNQFDAIEAMFDF